MAPRASWKGYIKLSLVSCPVRLYPAVSANEKIRFNQLHKETHNRINMKPVDPELGLVERSDLVKGYEYEDKQYVIIDESDLEAVRIESSHTLNIEAFVDAKDVDVIYRDAPYYLAPDGAMAEETFVVLREAMRKSDKLAIARLVLSSRERVVTIGARENGMFVTTLRNPNEVRGTAEDFNGIPEGKADPEMLALAEKLIEQKVTKFDPQNYEDRYEAALMEMIREKLKGHKPIVAAAPERGNVVNLMDALKASLSQSKPPAKSKGKGEPAVPMPKPAGCTVGVIEAEPEAAAATPAKAPSKAAAAKAALAKAAAAKPKAPARKKA
jgi:DNA end-binding protein Ku